MLKYVEVMFLEHMFQQNTATTVLFFFNAAVLQNPASVDKMPV